MGYLNTYYSSNKIEELYLLFDLLLAKHFKYFVFRITYTVCIEGSTHNNKPSKIAIYLFRDRRPENKY